MSSPRIKIYTRSFDLRLYSFAKGLFQDIKGPDGNPIVCKRLTDCSADGYFYRMLNDKECDIAVNIDEDAFIIDPQAVTDLITAMVNQPDCANIGYSDGTAATTFRNKIVTNPFFNVLNLRLIRTKYDKKALKRDYNDAEPYYPFFKWMAKEFDTVYLPCERHSDGRTTVAMDTERRVVCLHTWFSRFYSMPKWMIHISDKSASAQKSRIDAIIREAYATRGILVPQFTAGDRIRFAGDKTIRWIIKVPQRISRWPYKIKRKICRKFQS